MEHTDPRSLTRRPRNWDILQALESVSPPSPSPSFGSDFLATLASTGEIPIFLDSGDGRDGLEDVSSFSSRVVTPVPSHSVDTVQSLGTFGPRRVLLDGTADSVRYSYGSQRSSTTTRTGADSGYITSASHSMQYLSPHSPGYYDRRISSSSSRFTLSAYMSKSKKSADKGSLPGSPRSSSSGSAWNTPLPSSDTLNLPETYGRSPSIGASLSTIVFAAGSGAVSPTVSTSLATEAQLYASKHKQRPYVTTHPHHGQIDFPVSPADPVETHRSHTPTFRSSQSHPTSPLSSPALSPSEPRMRTVSSSTARSNDSGCSGHSGRSGPISPLGELTVQVTGLPPVLSWLQTVQLELWIDQEAFRLARPVFALCGYTIASAPDHDPDLVSALTYGSAEFRPVERQQFIFHHHALDPPPVLRKLTMAGDDSRDYLSRQASLAIKANGVYSVSGTESFESGPPSPHHTGPPPHSPAHQQPLRLTWRFEYLVEDGPGKAKAGDKTLTPLTFACSPGLLHPTHGKKIRIMHVVKKTLTPKLTSEKIGLPHPEPRIRIQTDPPGRSAAQSHARPLVGHRRAKSTSAQPLLPHDDRNSSAPEGNRSGAKKTRTTSLAIASRGVEPRPVPPLVAGDPLAASLSANRRHSLGPADDPLRQLSRHILPPTDLASLMDDQPSRHLEATTLAMTSLRPPPRTRHG